LSQHFFLKLIPQRTTFAQDMTAEERAIMLEHVAYWTGLMHQGIAVVFGPVMDPAGVYGVGIVQTENEEHLRSLMENDPAKTINRYEFWPMRAVRANLKPQNE
jgi:uncharacterized protein YciI